jgi:hypothetical protein
MIDGMKSPFKLTRMAAKYNEMKKSGRLLSNRESINVIRERIVELLERIDRHDAPERLPRLRKLWQTFLNQDELDRIQTRKEIDQLFEEAYHDYESWKQILEAVDLDRKLVESEVKVAKDMQAIITAEDAYELTAKLFAAVIDAIRQSDDLEDMSKSRILKRIEYEFTRTIGEDARAPAEEPDRGPIEGVVTEILRSRGEDGDTGSGEVD